MAATVLLVTHFADERTIYAESLAGYGFHIRVADGADDAVAIAIAQHPDVIVMRMQPGSTIDDGELLRRLKQADATACVPVIVITSLCESNVHTAALEAGCDAYLLLPVLPDVLAAQIRRVLPAGNGSSLNGAAPVSAP